MAAVALAAAGRPAFYFLAMSAGLFSLAFAAFSALLGLRLLRRLTERPVPTEALPPITVIKPLKGHEDTLYENLASLCRQDYPALQIVFCLQNPDDPALATVTRLVRDFPRLDVEIVVSNHRIGYNPKVNNMANAYAFAKHDLLLFSDSDVRLQPDFLRRMAAPFSDPKVGLVTSFYQAVGTHGLWGHLEALAINARFLPEAMAAASLGMRFAMGAAMMVRRAAFEQTGAFLNLADHLADDWRLGESVREAGWRLALCGAPAETVPQIDGGLEHVRHMTRWARTIHVCHPLGYAASLIQHGFSLLTLQILIFGPDRAAFSLLAALWAVKAGASALLAGRLGSRQPLRALWLLPLAEWCSFAAWIAGFGSNRVLWRGTAYEVRRRGRLVPVAPAIGRRPVPVEL